MNIIFDNIIFSLQKTGGISVVWYELLNRITKVDGINYKCLEYREKNQRNNIFRKLLEIPSSSIVYLNPFLFNIKRYFFVRFKEKKKFIFHSSYYRICKNRNAINITTVHDFTYERFSSGLRKHVHCWQKHKAVRNSDIIICISENTKDDLLKFVSGVNKDKISVIYNGVSDDYFPIDSDNLKEIKCPYEPYSYVLFVGSRKKYKNFELAVKAVAVSDFNIVIVGSELTKKENLFLESFLDNSRYCCKKGISNYELNKLYNLSFCLLYPSSYEGFGIPVIESQKAGCPVIAYNGSSIPEVIGKTPLLLNELSVNAIIEKFQIISNNKIRKDIINEGFVNAKRFSWQNMSGKVLDLYKKAISS